MGDSGGACGGTDCHAGAYLHSEGMRQYLGSNGGSVPGCRAPVLSRIVHVDLDGDAGSLDSALTTARQLVGFVTDRLAAGERSVFPNLSGSKGFHVGLFTGLFGSVEPGGNLPGVVHQVVSRLATAARLS